MALLLALHDRLVAAGYDVAGGGWKWSWKERQPSAAVAFSSNLRIESTPV
ncbi:MAG: hypothetical protein OYI31_02935 [Chloroflexota bacterium]|nr:hypothetical protein [Chloroflexota bacterium]MDE2941074.1 hypothetical protein [Chloroflexota bacterium]MDE3267400.1 hypothetical protein [Chloroflexota bacterium]